MKETREYIEKSLNEQVQQENELASLAIDRWAQHKGWIEKESPMETEEVNHVEESELESVEVDSIMEKDYPEKNEESLCRAMKKGLYAVAGAILILAVVHLGTYIHQVVSTHQSVSEATQAVEVKSEWIYQSGDRPEHFYHYESEYLPYGQEGTSIKGIPYALEEYLFRQLMGF